MTLRCQYCTMVYNRSVLRDCCFSCSLFVDTLHKALSQLNEWRVSNNKAVKNKSLDYWNRVIGSLLHSSNEMDTYINFHSFERGTVFGHVIAYYFEGSTEGVTTARRFTPEMWKKVERYRSKKKKKTL